MLKNATVKIRTNTSQEPQEVSLGEAYDTYCQAIEKGGIKPFEVYTYKPGTKKFSFKSPNYFRPKADVAALIGVEFTLPNGKTGVVITDVITRVLAATTKAANHITAIPLAALKNFRGGQVRFAYLDEESNEVVLCPMVRVFYPTQEAIKFNEDESKKAIAESREPNLKPVPQITTGDVVVLENNDGSFVVCDNLFMS